MSPASCLVLLFLLPTLMTLVAQSSVNGISLQVEHGKYVSAYKWCSEYSYCAPPNKKPEAMTVGEIKAGICEPVKAIKRFYGLDSSDCELTTKLLDIMSKPRCSREDEETCKSASCRRARRWTRMGQNTWKNMPVTYRIKTPLSSPTLSVADQEALVQYCSKLWTDNSGLRMQFQRNTARANIEIEFVYIDGPWGTIGRGLSPSYTGTSYQKLDSSEQWKRDRNDPRQGVSLRWGFCHEMGHNLGLGHSRDMNAIMYPSNVGQEDGRLSYDDLQGIQALYGGPGNNMQVNVASAVAPRPPPTQTVQRPQAIPRTARHPPTQRAPQPAPRPAIRRG